MVANTIPCPVFSRLEFTNKKKGAKLNNVAILSQGARVPVVNPVFKKTKNDKCSNL